MKERSADHATFVIERMYDTTPERVFAAWADASMKALWFQQAEEFDFRVGGRELNHGGPPGGPIYTFEAHYQEIVTGQRIVYSYIMDLDKTRISASVVTVEIEPAEAGTRMVYTEQGVFLDGHDTPAQREHGTNAMLDKIGEVLNESSSTVNGEGSNETVHTRLIDAPREIVFNAWTNPELLAKWWGPKGFTNTFQQFDARPGGLWNFIMHGPNGVDYPNQCRFDEISSPERMVIHHLSPVHDFLVIADFEEMQGKTKVTFCQRFETAEELNKLKKLVVPANEENLDRLAEVVRTLTRQE